MPDNKDKLIDGEKFSITQPYAEGHVITAAEAKALNQTRSENIGNNLREAVKAAKLKRDAATDADPTDFNGLADMVAKYDAEYTFAMGGSGVSTRKLDPIEREAKKIADETIKAHLAKTGRKISVTPEGETDESWSEKIDAQRDKLMTADNVVKLAKKRVAERQKVTDDAAVEL